MTNEQRASSEFESISAQIVTLLFEGKDVDITPTKQRKDGGYDIVVECKDGELIKRAFFECKLRQSNLNLRDIAANVIIAFNHGATAFVAITNHNFTKQLGKEVEEFAEKTVLNIKVIMGDDVWVLLQKQGIEISKTLRNCLPNGTSFSCDNKGAFRTLKIQFDKDVFPQIFCSQSEPVSTDPFWNTIFEGLPEKIYQQVDAGRLVMLYGFTGIGKQHVTEAALSRTRKKVIRINACLHDTRDPLILEILSKIWGIPEPALFAQMQESEIHEIAHWLGKTPNSDEIRHDITALLNENIVDKKISAQQNVLLSSYIADLAALHKNDIGYCFFIEKLQFCTKEVYDFLIYLIRRISEKNLGCVVLYDISEYSAQNGTDFRLSLQHISNYHPMQLYPMSSEMAEQYIVHTRPDLSRHAAHMILKRSGTRLYNLQQTLHYLFEVKHIHANDHERIAEAITGLTPNDIPKLIEKLLPSYEENFPEFFRALFLFDGKVPLYLAKCLQVEFSDLDSMVSAGILRCQQDMLFPHNELILAWIRQKYTWQSLSIRSCAQDLLHHLKDEDGFIPERISLYCVLGKFQCALELINLDLSIQIRDRQYTVLLRELILAVELTKKMHDNKMRLHYLSQLLDLYVIIKKITSNEAKVYLDEFRSCLAHTPHPTYYDYALVYFDLKRDFKFSHYTSDYCSVVNGAIVFQDCIDGKAVDNTDDWLGKLCSCYALIIKSTKGNGAALDAFKQVRKRLSDSFEIHREYLSHLACMKLFTQPEQAFILYQKILDLFKEKTPNFAELPFHEYGDLAMSLLLAGRLEEAFQKCEEAISISQSNGLLDEEGRNLNILGCIKLCQKEQAEAKHCFREATAAMRHAGCRHYAWRSELNEIQLRIIGGEDDVSIANELRHLYDEFKALRAEKIKNLALIPGEDFRQTREYHALLVFGLCLTKIKVEGHDAHSIPTEFGLINHTNTYCRDLSAYMAGQICIPNSPYFYENIIFSIG